MSNEKLLKLINELLEDERVKTFEITWNGDLGEYPGQIVKPNIKITKRNKIN